MVDVPQVSAEVSTAGETVPEPSWEPVPLTVMEIQLFWMRMPLVAPFHTSTGSTRERECLLVRLQGRHPERGPVEGWGEVVTPAEPTYSYETTGTAWHVLTTFLLPALLGRTLSTPADLQRSYARVRGHPMAKAGVEMAFLDARARLLGVPLWQVYGGDPARRRVPAGISLGIAPSLDQLLRAVDEALNRGYRRVKIKIQPGWDREPVRALRRQFGDLPLMVDANGAYTPPTAGVLAALDAEGLLMIEQPFAERALVDHSRWQRRLRTPLCLDESVQDRHDAQTALALAACRVINVKLGRVGGLQEARAIHDLCRRQGVPLWCGGMLETGVGRAHNIALSTLPGFTLPGDLSASDRYYREDLIDPPVGLNPDGTVTVPQEPGLGFHVVAGRLARYCRRHRVWRA